VIAGLVDTNILIEVYRGNKLATAWYKSQPDLAISSVAWLEFVEGASGKAGQKRCLEIIAPLDLVFLTEADQRWAMMQVLRYRLSHGVSFKDCLIASACYRLQVPVYTRNVKDFVPLLSAAQVIKPYAIS
jgi:predicted nucleic acid-binding protein